jgi:flagellar protein FlaI
MEQPPIEVPRALISALNMVLIQAQVKVGTKMTRRVKSLTEIVGVNPDNNELISNAVYNWNPADDTFNYSGHSYIYEQIAVTKGWSQREMMREVKRRTRLLLYLKSKNVSYKNVAKYGSAYYKDPDKVMKEVDDSGFTGEE